MTDGRATTQVVAIGLVLQALLALAFVLPQHDPEPHGLPIAVAAPAAAQVQQRLGEVVDVRSVGSEGEARALIEDREAVGALLGRRVLVASGASPAAAQLLRQLAAGDRGSPVAVQELAPLQAGDSRGTTLGAMMLPLVIACLPFALLLWRTGASRRATLGAVVAFAVLGGLSVAAIAQVVVDALPGSYLGLAGVLAAGIAAIALPAVAAARAAGLAGFAAVAFLVFLIGNPASGAANGADFLPSPWREISGLLPPGAVADAVRSVAWFDGAGAGGPLAVLAAWALLGLGLLRAPARVAVRSPTATGGATASSAASAA